MRIAWVHRGELRAPLCIQGDVMAHFAGRREIGVKFPVRAALVDPKSTQLTPLTITHSARYLRKSPHLQQNIATIDQNGRPGRWEAPGALVRTKLIELCRTQKTILLFVVF